MRAIIMAQGSQSRLRSELGDQPKQLLEIGGEPLVGRTVRMLRHLTLDGGSPQHRSAWESLGVEFGVDRAHVYRAGGPAWEAFEARPETRMHCPTFSAFAAPGRCVVEGIAQALDHHLHYWPAERLLVLLGDVAWSRKALRALVDDPRPLVFCGWSPVTGSLGEIYGVACAPAVLPLLLQHCTQHVAVCRTAPYNGPQPGHLRTVLWSLTSTAYRGEPAWRQQPPACWLEADGITMDVDTPDDLLELRTLEPLLCKED